MNVLRYALVALIVLACCITRESVAAKTIGAGSLSPRELKRMKNQGVPMLAASEIAVENGLTGPATFFLTGGQGGWSQYSIPRGWRAIYKNATKIKVVTQQQPPAIYPVRTSKRYVIYWDGGRNRYDVFER